MRLKVCGHTTEQQKNKSNKKIRKIKNCKRNNIIIFHCFVFNPRGRAHSLVCTFACLKTWIDCTYFAPWNTKIEIVNATSHELLHGQEKKEEEQQQTKNWIKEELKLPPPLQQVFSIKHWMCFNEQQKKKKEEEDDEANVLSVWVWLSCRSKKKTKFRLFCLSLSLFAFIDRSLFSSSFHKRAANFIFLFLFFHSSGALCERAKVCWKQRQIHASKFNYYYELSNAPKINATNIHFTQITISIFAKR